MNEDASDEVSIFTEAIKIPSEERPAFLDMACAGNADLRQKVEALLKAHDRLGSFLENPPNRDSEGRES